MNEIITYYDIITDGGTIKELAPSSPNECVTKKDIRDNFENVTCIGINIDDNELITEDEYQIKEKKPTAYIGVPLTLYIDDTIYDSADIIGIKLMDADGNIILTDTGTKTANFPRSYNQTTKKFYTVEEGKKVIFNFENARVTLHSDNLKLTSGRVYMPKTITEFIAQTGIIDFNKQPKVTVTSNLQPMPDEPQIKL